jgi:parallel beta-helix repeat protein
MRLKAVAEMMLITLLLIGMLTLAFNFKLDKACANPAPSEAELPVYKVGEYWYLKYRNLTDPRSPWNLTQRVIGEGVVSGIDCYVMNVTYKPDIPWNNTGLLNDMKGWFAKSQPVLPVKEEAHGYTASSGYSWVWNKSFTFQTIEGPNFWPIMVNKALKLNTTTTEDVWLTAFNGTPITPPYHYSHKGWFNVTWMKAEAIENVTVLGVKYEDCFKVVTYDETNTTVISRAWYSPQAEYWVKSEYYLTQEYYDLISFHKPEGTRYPWSMFRHDLEHTGYTESPAPNTNQTQWNYTTGNGVSSSPAVADGKVYVGSCDHKVYCLDALTGAHIWNYTTGSAVVSSPAVAGGVVYVGSWDHKVYALNAFTGALVWNYTTGGTVVSSPAVAGGLVYVGSYDDKVYALNAFTGALVWNYTTGSAVVSSPAVAGGVVYVGSWDHKVYALNAFTGALVWNYTTGGTVVSSPAVAGGMVYVGSESNVYALNAATGALVWGLGWNYTTGGNMTVLLHSSPAVAGGVVFGGSYVGDVYALNATTSALVWKYTTGGAVVSSPAVAGGLVYVGSYDDKVYALNAATGASVWNYTTGSAVVSSPTVADGVVYIGSLDGTVYAFGNVVRVPQDFPTVQAAINAAAPGATIIIAPGIYNTSIVINKTLTIIGLPGSDGPKYKGGGSGIAVTISSGASGSIVTGITITNWNQGILVNGSSNIKIYNNAFQQNSIAINLTQSSTGTTICANTFSQNSIGIILTNSNGNTIYHNNFIGNTQQVSVSGSSNNVWDNGYPSGGNYWSDYTGVDLKSGPNQDQPGSDGIGDTPYTKGGITDQYPLMNPWPYQITQPSLPVGGLWIPVDKFALLAPYIALASTIILAIAITAVFVKYKKKRQALT